MSKLLLAPDLGAPLGFRLAFERIWRKTPVGRVDDQGRPFRAHHLVTAVVPELVVGNDAASGIIDATNFRVDEIAILATVLLLLVLRSLLVSEKRFVSEGNGAL